MATHNISGDELGLRERGKRDKRRRIEHAAYDVFREHGYDGATMREIANRADVALGTLFVYARDKRDLLILCFNSELDRLAGAAANAARTDAPLLDQVIEVYGARYEFWALEPALARAALREFNDPYIEQENDGDGDFPRSTRRMQLVQLLTDMVRRRRLSLQITLDEDDETYAWLIADIYLSEVRLWLNNPNPEPAAGIARMRRVMRVALTGTGLDELELAAKPVAHAKS
jgi:AcrR family transcriptional regulator